MSLATRCPACSTVFRVVQDQLRVSEGWVRCGQCQEVFNALETLFDLDTEPAALPPSPPAAAPLPPPSPAPAMPPAAAPAPAPAPALDPAVVVDDEFALLEDSPHPADVWNPDQATLPMSLEALAASYRADQERHAGDLRHAPAPPPLPSPPPPPPPLTVTPPPAAADDVTAPFTAPSTTPIAAPVPTPLPAREEDDAEAPTPSRFIGPVPDWARTPTARERRRKAPRRGAGGGGEPQAQPHPGREGARRRRKKPEFVRQAERAAQWRRPMVRVGLGLAATALAALLAAQVAYHHRDQLAARAPALAPALHAGCAWLGCRIAAPRALEHIRLDASDLTRTGQEQVLRFVADLRNTAGHAVRAPALDLSLTNAAGEVVSRKVLLPAELNAPGGEAIAADSPWRVDALLAVGELRVAGYTVEVFYP